MQEGRIRVGSVFSFDHLYIVVSIG